MTCTFKCKRDVLTEEKKEEEEDDEPFEVPDGLKVPHTMQVVRHLSHQRYTATAIAKYAGQIRQSFPNAQQKASVDIVQCRSLIKYQAELKSFSQSLKLQIRRQVLDPEISIRRYKIIRQAVRNMPAVLDSSR